MATLDQRLERAKGLLDSDPAAALEQANVIAADKPNAHAFRLAAAALRALNRPEEAAEMELKGISASFTQPLRQARAAHRSGRSSEAKTIADERLREEPDDLLAMTIAAEACLGMDRPSEAEPVLRQVVARAPTFPPANLLLANALASQLRLHDAVDVLESFLKWSPGETNAKRFLGDLRAQMNDPSGAISAYADLLASDPHNPADRFKYAHFLRVVGRKGESVDALRLVAQSPAARNAWWALAHYFPEALTEEDEQRIRAAAATGLGPAGDRGLLQLAASILEQRRGNHEAAFKAITSAQALLRGGAPYDPASLNSHVNQLIAAYSPQALECFASDGSSSDAPIFIVGMPRSGSTLLERILGQHSKIEAAGELPVLPRIVAMGRPGGSAAYRSLLPDDLMGGKLAEMADFYLDRSREYRLTEKPHFTDKYNGNWLRTGMIKAMFPNAKIVDIRRNALDSCWAVFKSVLVGDYANDQRHVARYYADYVRLMDAMAAGSPGSILTVSYESLVEDVEGQTRRMLDFLGLDFEQECVDFHLSKAAVTTASSEQVRRPANRDSIGSANPYRAWLGPMIEELEARLGTGV